MKAWKMEDRPPVIYGLEYQSRALAARSAETERIQFICGTLSIRNENQIYLVDYDEETGVLNKMIFPYSAGEIWDIACGSEDKDLAMVCHGYVEDNKYIRQASLVKMEGSSPEDNDAGALQTSATFPSTDAILNEQGGRVCHLSSTTTKYPMLKRGIRSRCSWHPTSGTQVATITDKGCISVYALDNGAPRNLEACHLESRQRVGHALLSWNTFSHHGYSQFLIGADSAVYSWDTREKVKLLFDHRHSYCVRDISNNPNKPYYFATCGDDCTVKFWDIRKLDNPLLSRKDHSHWVWSVQYNAYHDQLVLSASSDSQVLLSRVASIASEPLKHTTDEEDTLAQQMGKDEVIKKYEEHEDSVYSVRWSTTDAWVFASLSYDGRLVINHVPSDEKYSILTS